MRLEPEVKRENCKIAVGSAILSVIVGVVFFALGKFDYTVAIGIGIGFLLAVGNFFFMSVGVARALEERDESAAKLKLRSSYTTRTFAILAVVAASLLLDWINPVPVLLSVFYANIIIKGTNFWNTFVLKKGSEETITSQAPIEDEEDEENAPDEFDKFVSKFAKGPIPGENKDENKTE